MKLSYWEDQYYFEGNDLIVIGAGIVGLSTAIAMKSLRPDCQILVLERGSLPSGASTKNAGFACFGSVTELIEDGEAMTEQELKDLIALRWSGLQLLKETIGEQGLRYQHRGGVELLDNDSDLAELALSRLDYYNALVEDAIGQPNCFQAVDQTVAKHKNPKAIYNPYEGEINPMHMMANMRRVAESSGIKVLYGVEVSEINPQSVLANGKRLKATHIAVCTNGLSKQLLPNIELKAVRNQVYVTPVLDQIPFQGCYHYDQGYVYFRELEGRVLIGGARNHFYEQETTSTFGETDNVRAHLLQFVQSQLGLSVDRFDYRWSGILGVGDIKAPIIESIDAYTHVGVRLGGMGVAIGSGVGRELAKRIAAH